MIQWIKNLFRPPEYEVRIWDAAGNSQVFYFRKITDISNIHIVGKDSRNYKFEYSSTEPFNYIIKKIH